MRDKLYPQRRPFQVPAGPAVCHRTPNKTAASNPFLLQAGARATVAATPPRAGMRDSVIDDEAAERIMVKSGLMSMVIDDELSKAR